MQKDWRGGSRTWRISQTWTALLYRRCWNIGTVRRSLKAQTLTRDVAQIGYGSNKKTRHMMPSGHKAFLVNNTRDLDLLLMHNRTYAAE